MDSLEFQVRKLIWILRLYVSFQK